MPFPPARAVSTRRNPSLDGLRGIAVLLVFFFHYGGGLKSPHLLVRILGHITETGWTGVTLFFVLSGFLITGSLWDSLGERRLLLNFYVRRALRILPLYYAALILAFAVSLARGVRLAELSPLLLYAGFLQNVPVFVNTVQAFPSQLPLNHLWSMAVEEQFYILWPAVVLFSRSRKSALYCSLWIVAASELFTILTHLPSVPSYLSAIVDPALPTHCGTLAMGAALALAIRGPHWQRLERWILPAFFAGILLYLASSSFSHSFYLYTRTQFIVGLFGVGLASTAAIPLVMRHGARQRFFSVAPLRFMGRVSYGFYVLHILMMPLIDALTHKAIHLSSGQTYQLVRLLIAFVLTLAFASLSYYMLELPFLELKRRFPMRSPLPSPARTASSRT